MKKSLAKIDVQEGFCKTCAGILKEELEKINGIEDVFPNPSDSFVVFHFVGANELALALNKLMELGHPPLGDTIKEEYYVPPLCQCNGINTSAA